MPSNDLAITVCVDAGPLFNSLTFNEMYEGVLRSFSKSIKSRSTTGSLWEWTITAPTNQQKFEQDINKGRRRFMDAFGRFILGQMEKGKIFMEQALASGGPNDVNVMGVELLALRKSTLHLKEKAGQPSRFFEKRGHALPGLLAEKPKLVGSQGATFVYSWEYKNTKWTKFNLGDDSGFGLQPARPAVDIFKNYLVQRVLSLMASGGVINANSYGDLTNWILGLADA